MGGGSVHPAMEVDVREQLTALESHVEELTKMQEETMLTLQMLTSSLAEHRQRRLEQQQEKRKKHAGTPTTPRPRLNAQLKGADSAQLT